MRTSRSRRAISLSRCDTRCSTSRRLLEYAGSSIDKIAKVNVYLDRRADFDEMNEIYKEFFGSDQSGWPARTTVEARLPRKDFLLEIDCVAEA